MSGSLYCFKTQMDCSNLKPIIRLKSPGKKPCDPVNKSLNISGGALTACQLSGHTNPDPPGHRVGRDLYWFISFSLILI